MINVFKNKKIPKTLRILIPAIIICAGVFGTIELSVQQDYRQTANDPQIQIAEDQARAFESGQKTDSINSLPKVDLTTSLSPFIIVYDSQGNPIASSAILNGRLPVPPTGVFDSANSQSEDRITWQPSSEVRIAAVIVPFHGSNPGYVLAGRSLKEVEKREDMLTKQVALGFILTLICIVIFGILLI